MDTKTMHIGIDVALKTRQHSLFGRFLPEEKDFILNKVINDLVHKTAEDARHSILNVESYSDITAFYNVLEPLLIRKHLEYIGTYGKYSEYELPKYKEILSALGDEIFANITYKVSEIGVLNSMLITTTPNLRPLEIVTPAFKENDLFTWSPENTRYVNINNTLTITIHKGVKYKIIRSGNLDFTPYGATSNNIGTIFSCTNDHTYTGDFENMQAILQPISFTPYTTGDWDNMELITMLDQSIFDYISILVRINTKSFIRSTNSEKLVKGSWYRVSTAGEFDNLTDYGSEYNVVEEGYIFMATVSGRPTWALTDDGVPVVSPVVLELVVAPTCRVIKPQDVSNFLEHSYGTTITSPIATFSDGKIQIYHESKFSIVDVEILYVRPPATIDFNAKVNCDLNKNLHPRIITLAVEDIVSTNNPQLYPTVNAQSEKQKTP